MKHRKASGNLFSPLITIGFLYLAEVVSFFLQLSGAELDIHTWA